MALKKTQYDLLVEIINTYLADGTIGLSNIKTLIDAIPTTAMRGTDSAALASVLGALDTAAATGAVSNAKMAMAYIKQIVTLLLQGTYGLSALQTLLAAIPTTAMRGTDNAALAASWTGALATALGNYTAARAGYLDELAAANLPTDIAALNTLLSDGTYGLAALEALVDDLETRLSAVRAGYLDELDFDLQGTLATIAAYIDTEIGAIETKLDTPANFMANLTTLETRLSAVRAGYLDELDFALQEAIAALQTDLDNPAQYKADLTTLETRLSAARAGYLDELDFDLAAAIAAIPTTMVGTNNAALAANWTAALATALGNYTAVRAGYLDQLDFALQEAIAALQTDLDNPAQYKADLTTLETRLSAVRAGYLDELAAANLPTDVAAIITDLANATDGLGALKALIDAVKTVVDSIPTTAMRGTDSAALASAWTAALATALGNYTAARAGYLDNIDTKAMGRKQVIEVSITSAANVGDVTVATITTQPCVIESIVIHADGAQTGDMTSCGIFGGVGKVVTFISAADAVQAELDAADKQVGWTGVVRLAATKTIVISLVGTGATAVDLTITITYRAAVSGGYLT